MASFTIRLVPSLSAPSFMKSSASSSELIPPAALTFILLSQQARSSAIEQGLKACTQPPLAVMQLCAEGLELLESLLGKTNATAASDFGVACLSLRAGMQGAWLNVCINTGSLHDAAFAAGARAAGQKLLDTGLPRADRCYAAMLAACSEK